jgi:hypothetical protein
MNEIGERRSALVCLHSYRGKCPVVTRCSGVVVVSFERPTMGIGLPSGERRVSR